MIAGIVDTVINVRHIPRAHHVIHVANATDVTNIGHAVHAILVATVINADHGPKKDHSMPMCPILRAMIVWMWPLYTGCPT
jgi:hypothetical protein